MCEASSRSIEGESRTGIVGTWNWHNIELRFGPSPSEDQTLIWVSSLRRWLEHPWCHILSWPDDSSIYMFLRREVWIGERNRQKTKGRVGRSSSKDCNKKCKDLSLTVLIYPSQRRRAHDFYDTNKEASVINSSHLKTPDNHILSLTFCCLAFEEQTT